MYSFKPTYITQKIYQNGYIEEKRAEALARLGISHILNLDLPYDSTFIDLSGLGLKITELLVYDQAPLDESVAQKIIAIMHRSLDIEKGTIYVHCNAGLSRSPTAVWLYLVTHGTSEEKATEMLASSAPHLFGPDPVLLYQLDIPKLIEWRTRPRWELWRKKGFSQSLEALFESKEAALIAFTLLEKKNKQIVREHFRLEEA